MHFPSFRFIAFMLHLYRCKRNLRWPFIELDYAIARWIKSSEIMQHQVRYDRMIHWNFIENGHFRALKRDNFVIFGGISHLVWEKFNKNVDFKLNFSKFITINLSDRSRNTQKYGFQQFSNSFVHSYYIHSE